MKIEKLIVILLLLAILLSVITLAIAMNTDTKGVFSTENKLSYDSGTASIILQIVRNPAKGGLA